MRYRLTLPLIFITSWVQANDDFFHLSLDQLQSLTVSVASGFEENTLDVASSVTVHRDGEWKKLGYTRLSQVYDSVPGMATFDTWGGAQAVAVRGYATELSVRGVATLIDGVPVNTYAYGSAAYDKPNWGLATLSRIETIRGPGSTLYGSDAFHGVVAWHAYFSDQDEVSTNLRAGAPRFSEASTRISWGGEETRWSFALQGQVQGDQARPFTYVDPRDTEPYGGERAHESQDVTLSLVGKTGILARGEWEWGFYGYQFKADGAAGSGTHFFQGNTFQLDKDISDGEGHFLLGRVQYGRRLSDAMEVSLKLSTWTNEHTWVFDNTRFEGFCSPNYTDPATECLLGIPGHYAYQFTQESHDHGTVELKYASPSHQWVAAVGVRESRIDQADLERVASDGDWAGFYQVPDYDHQQRQIQYALFQGKYHFGEWQWVYGVRYDDYDDVGGHTSPRTGVIYRWSDHWSTKLLYGHAFRAPMALEYFGVATVVGNPDIEPETIDTYEWVIQYARDAWQWEAVVYFSEWKDAITLTGDPGLPPGFGIYKNIGSNEAKGIEGSLAYYQLPWSVKQTYSYNQSENTLQSIDYLAFPTHILHTDVSYQWATLPLTVSLQQHIQLDQYESDYLSTSGGLQKPGSIDEYWRVDLSLSYRVDPTQLVRLHIRNIADRENTKPSVYNSEGGILDEQRHISIEWDASW